MSDVFDLDAVEAETNDNIPPFPFKFGGEQFTLPNYVDQRIAALGSRGRTFEALSIMLGEDQFKRINGMDVVFDDARFGALLTAWSKHIRENLGESSASTDSSKSTGRPSKRTSSGTTKSRSRTSSAATSAGDGSES